MSPIRVMIVDDHQLIRASVARVLELYDDIEVVGEAGSCEEALEVCARTLPDVILMDLILQGIDGIIATYTIKQRNPNVQVIALTAYENPGLVNRTLQAGARGYLLKEVLTGKELHEAIRRVNAGQEVLSPEVAHLKNKLS